MIDLTKPQILAEPIKCWVKGNEETWQKAWLVGIIETDEKFTQGFAVANLRSHERVPTYLERLNVRWWKYCTLTDPYIRAKRQMTHAEIFKAIRDGAVVRGYLYLVSNHWNESRVIGESDICYKYTGADADVWQSMEVEDES